MARFLQGAPFQMGAVTLAVILAVAGLIRVTREPRCPVPGLPGDGDPLECWEWDEMDRIEAFYGASADEPASPGRPS